MCSFLLIISLLLLLSTKLDAIDTCYWPHGNNATGADLIPCYGSRYSNVCCYGGAVCLSNGLCYGMDIGYLYRGACTDPTWDKTNCPQQQCSKTVPSQHANLMPCPSEPNGYWTCGGDGWSDTICAGSELWSYQPVAATPGAVLLPENLQAAIVSSWGSSTTSTSTATASSIGASATGALSTTTSGIILSTQCPQNSSRSTALGAGLGVGIGVPLLAALAGMSFLYIRERRARKTHHFEALPTKHVNAGEEFLDRDVRPQELGGEGKPAELPGHIGISDTGMATTTGRGG